MFILLSNVFLLSAMPRGQAFSNCRFVPEFSEGRAVDALSARPDWAYYLCVSVCVCVHVCECEAEYLSVYGGGGGGGDVPVCALLVHL